MKGENVGNFFYVYETVDFSLELQTENINGLLDDIKNIIVSFEQRGTKVEKDINSEDVSIDTENNIVNIHLKQEETGKFETNNDVYCQINLLYNSGERDVTDQVAIKALKNIHKEIMQ